MQRRATREIRSVSVPWLASMRGALVSAGNREWCRGVAVCVCERAFSFAPNGGSSSRACLIWVGHVRGQAQRRRRVSPGQVGSPVTGTFFV